MVTLYEKIEREQASSHETLMDDILHHCCIALVQNCFASTEIFGSIGRCRKGHTARLKYDVISKVEQMTHRSREKTSYFSSNHLQFFFFFFLLTFLVVGSGETEE